MAGEPTEQVIGLAIEVHRHTECLCHELHEAGIPLERQVAIPVIYKRS
jgi:hypothetical protein